MQTRLSRRGVLGAAALSVVAARPVAAQVATPAASPVTGDTIEGVAGGGTLSQLGVEVQFSMMAVTTPGQDGESRVYGFLKLVDATIESTPLVIEGNELISCEQLSDSVPHGRRIIGWASVNGGDRLPYVLQVEDNGEPGSGEDTFNLVLGEAAVAFLGEQDAASCNCKGFSYSLLSNVLSGDIALINPPI